MGWGVTKKLNKGDTEISVLVSYDGGEEIEMSAEDYLSTGYDPPLNNLPWAESDA